ncbi:MAG: class I SAM-dependent methyltransferase [Bacillus subtilis]|nr:class I SAM-dependent methyltransferase [Bacillus subtilis]
MAEAYAKIFPVDEDTLHFALRLWKQGRILDLACGNGGYSIELARRGLDVEGLDLSQTMIHTARELARIKPCERRI